MEKQYQMVRKFHEVFGEKMPDVPTALNEGFSASNNGFLANDLDGLIEEMKHDSKLDPENEVLKRASFIGEELVEFLRANTIEDQVDALTDILYFTIGTFTLLGLNPEPFFKIVQDANMGKVWGDGEVHRDAQGKIEKPPGWKERFAPEPLIINEIKRQAGEAFYTEYAVQKNI